MGRRDDYLSTLDNQSFTALEASFVDDEPTNDFFDRNAFDARIWWPAINVSLLSQPNENGVVERVGIGRIHVTAFKAVEKHAEILLG